MKFLFCALLAAFSLWIGHAEVVVLRQVQVIYDKSPKLRIRGSGFDATEADIHVEISALDQRPLVVNKDFMLTKDFDGDGVILKLISNRRWVDLTDRNPPVALILHAVKFGLDQTNLLPEPIIIAQVLPQPGIASSEAELQQSASSELRINGTGLVGAKKCEVYFSPPLPRDVVFIDVTPYPLRTNQVVLRLNAGQRWRESPGPLYLLGVDTGGGPVKLDEDTGVMVADVVADSSVPVSLPVQQPTSDPAFPSSSVTVLAQTQYVYAPSPRLRIRGSGFDVVDAMYLMLNISAPGQPSLVSDRDFTIEQERHGDGIILYLLTNRVWVDLTTLRPPVPLVLSAVRFGSYTNKNVLEEPVTVAQVLSVPSVTENNELVIRQSESLLIINGAGFVGGTKVDLFFRPSLIKVVNYEDITRYPLSSNQIVLRLRAGYKWREQPGPMLVVAADTGAGPVKFGDDGVLVATVFADSTNGGIVIPSVYTDSPEITILGTGFSLTTALHFTNGIVGSGVNYTIIAASETKMTVHLVPGSLWMDESADLPAMLSIAALSVSDDVFLPPDVVVARVFARPRIIAGEQRIFRTYSHELYISGAGFPVHDKVLLRFGTPLLQDVDYYVRVESHTQLVLVLLDSRAWRPTAGALYVTHINTRGDTDGWVSLGEGVRVAEVIDDTEPIVPVEDAVQVFPSYDTVYESCLIQKIVVKGANFKATTVFVFEPAMTSDDYSQLFVSTSQIELRLKYDKKWPSQTGFIAIKGVSVGSVVYPLNAPIAYVLANPVIDSALGTYHESQSKIIVITGAGFTTVMNTKVLLRPAPPNAYKVVDVQHDRVYLQLLPGKRWLPPFMSLDNEEPSKRVPIQVLSINTGAGEITFNDPTTVGFIVKDIQGVECDDSCAYAFDGVCNEVHTTARKLLDQDDHFQFSSPKDTTHTCAPSTDCTDCGGVEALPICTNTCMYPRDGVCDDPRGSKYCAAGTDCQDCGPSGAPINNTNTDKTDPEKKEDDDYWKFNDGDFENKTDGGVIDTRHFTPHHRQDTGDMSMFLILVIALPMIAVVGVAIARCTMLDTNKTDTGIAMSVRSGAAAPRGTIGGVGKGASVGYVGVKSGEDGNGEDGSVAANLQESKVSYV